MSLLESAPVRARMRRRLLEWFDENQRDLPWRRRRSRYRIWVSEIMLQQTQVVTVVDYYQRFMKRFPSVKQLAAADEQDVLRLWEGLGYYRRARQMHQAAKIVMDEHGGKFPDDIESVRALPGIGRYTAAAILSIADDQRHPIVEGNTMRLYSRMFGYPLDPRSNTGQLAMWDYAELLLGRKRPGDTNQAFMELGSEICRLHDPLCGECPVRRYCAADDQDIVAEIPAKPEKRTKYEDKHEAAVVIRRNGKLLLRQCDASQRWEGLWDFPRFDVTDAEDIEQTLRDAVLDLTGLKIDPGQPRKQLRHAVTRFRIELSCFVATKTSGTIPKSRLSNRNDSNVLCWADEDELSSLPLNVTGRKIANWVSQNRDE